MLRSEVVKVFVCSIGTSGPWIIDSPSPPPHPAPPLLFILKILTGIRVLVLVEKSLKILEGKDQDVREGGAKIEQRELPCMEEFDEIASGRNWRWCNTFSG